MYHPEAEREVLALPTGEYAAMRNALEKLVLFGDRLGFPHTSQVKGARSLRELRPRAGRSPWRAFYRRVGDRIVIGSIGPEAHVDTAAFRRALRVAEERIDAVERE